MLGNEQSLAKAEQDNHEPPPNTINQIPVTQ